MQYPIRLDVFLSKKYPDYSRSFFKKHLQDIALIKGKTPLKSSLVENEDDVEINHSLLKRLSENETELCTLDCPPILFENEDYLVVEKSAHIPVLPLSPFEKDTLIQSLFKSHPQLIKLGKKNDFGLLHRLDNESSGLMLVALHKKSYLYFRELFSQRKIKKKYLAWVEGVVDQEASSQLPIIHHPKNKKKMKVLQSAHPKAQEAITLYKPLKIHDPYTLLEVEIITGVRHQIRTHLAYMGKPLVGDLLYGASVLGREQYQRILLHAAELEFEDLNQKNKKYKSESYETFTQLL